MKLETFDTWLDNQLKDTDYTHFDSDGNSAHAVVLRYRKSKIAALKYEIKEVARDLKYGLTQFEGFDTPIGWFLQLIAFCFLFWLSPFTRTYSRYRNAISDYKESYAQYVTHTQRANNANH